MAKKTKEETIGEILKKLEQSPELITVPRNLLNDLANEFEGKYNGKTKFFIFGSTVHIRRIGKISPKVFKLKILTNPLSKGENWEKKDTREIEITQSSDNRGMKPNVYFGISKGKKITEDFFLTTDTAREIANAMIKQADLIDKKSKRKS